MTEKEQFIFDLREEVYNLKWHVKTMREAELVEQIGLILTRIIDYIEKN